MKLTKHCEFDRVQFNIVMACNIQIIVVSYSCHEFFQFFGHYNFSVLGKKRSVRTRKSVHTLNPFRNSLFLLILSCQNFLTERVMKLMKAAVNNQMFFVPFSGLIRSKLSGTFLKSRIWTITNRDSRSRQKVQCFSVFFYSTLFIFNSLKRQ